MLYEHITVSTKNPDITYSYSVKCHTTLCLDMSHPVFNLSLDNEDEKTLNKFSIFRTNDHKSE